MCAPALAAEVVTNGSFEMPRTSTTRPQYWYIGFPETPESYADNGSWTLDSNYSTDGNHSLCLIPASDSGYGVSQILHVSTHDLQGKTVTVSVDVRRVGLTAPPYVIIFALNPTLSPDPVFGIGLAGKAIIAADGPDDEWRTYTDSFVATDNAICLTLVITTEGTIGNAWFDNVSVLVDVPSPGPDPAARQPVLARREFRLGFVGENPQDLSEKAEEEMIEKIAASAEVMNIFFHVRWTSLTGESVSWGHRSRLQQAQLARDAGLDLILALDFTHGSADTVGDINPAPDGSPPPGASPFDLTNNVVRQAYKEEILELAALIDPKWILVGIEMDIFYGKHPDEWDEYVTMYNETFDALKADHPDALVGAYFCLPWMVSPAGALNATNVAIWRQLLPKLDFIGYSIYLEVGLLEGVALDNGYFITARQVAPDLPLLLAEFGIPGGAGAVLSETDQAVLLERIFKELSGVDVEVATWYSVYDIDYIGAPVSFQDAFGKIGIFKQDGTAKEVFAVWNAAYETRNPFKSRKKKSGGCSFSPLPLSANEDGLISHTLLPLIFLLVILLLRKPGRDS